MSPTDTPLTPAQEIQKAYNEYTDFDNNTLWTDAQNFAAKKAAWLNLTKSVSPEVAIMMFWMMLVVGGDTKGTGLANDGSSYTRNQENSLVEVSKELNYASAYRDAVADIKNQLVNATATNPGDPEKIREDLLAIMHFNNPAMFPASGHAPQIFSSTDDDVFGKANKDIQSILAKIGTGPGQYASFYALAQAAQQVDPGKANQASTDFQTFVNGADNLFSAVGVQQNILSTQLQDTESDYKSVLSSDTSAMKAYFSISTFAIQHDIPG
jgi:hypothetical protein